LLIAVESAAQTPAAKIGDEIITMEEITGLLQGQLAQIERQRHNLIDQRLRQLIDERLLTQEAARQGMTPEQLLEKKIHDTGLHLDGSEVSEFIRQNQTRLPPGDEFEVRMKVWDYLRAQKIERQRHALVERLRKQTEIVVYLEEPAGARVQVNTVTAFVRGPEDAPVTIVEFSDFQCPFCRAILPSIKALMLKYPEHLKLVFMDFPIKSLHPDAPKAHEAARCAGEQGKFWQYHDLLFDRSPRHSLDDLIQAAQNVGLDHAAFAECLASKRYQPSIQRHVEEGSRLGIAGTPTLFVNGRMVAGENPIVELPRLVEAELAKIGAADFHMANK
jgi:protein-disulfide isomerase